MMLYVNGQDIARLVLGTLEGERWLIEPQVFEVRPENYLSGLEAFLRQAQIEHSAITGFVLVQGPGSATSLRTSHALVNALAFAWGIKIVSLEKPLELSDVEVLKSLSEHAPHAFALPSYTRDPNITATKRDALKRKTA